MSDKQIVIAGTYIQFVVWCRDTERDQNEYKWVSNASLIQGVASGTKVLWLTPWPGAVSPSALERYDELVELVRLYQLDVEYVRVSANWNA